MENFKEYPTMDETIVFFFLKNVYIYILILSIII